MMVARRLIALLIAVLLALLATLALLLSTLLAGLRLILVFLLLVLLLLVLLARRIVLVRHVVLQAWGLYQPNQEMRFIPSSFREPLEFPMFHASLCLPKLTACLVSRLQYRG